MSQTIKAKIEELRKRSHALAVSSPYLGRELDAGNLKAEALDLVLDPRLSAALDAAEKMPVTGDGVRIYSGMNVVRTSKRLGSRMRADIGVIEIHWDGSDEVPAWIKVRSGDGDEWMEPADELYSTEAAALAAEAALAGDGEGKGETR